MGNQDCRKKWQSYCHNRFVSRKKIASNLVKHVPNLLEANLFAGPPLVGWIDLVGNKTLIYKKLSRQALPSPNYIERPQGSYLSV
jgi:hypothetical protein